MKKFFLLVCIPVFSISRAQDNPFTFNEVVKVDSVERATLYNRAKRWIDSSYASAQSVIQTDDSINKIIVVKAAFIVHVSDGFVRDGGNVRYTLSIQCKDGRYKITLADFIHHHGSSDLGDGGDLNKTKPSCSPLDLPKYYWHQIKEQATEHRDHLISSIKSALGFNRMLIQNNDW